MKKVLLFLLAAMLALPMMAQADEHMLFMGIPIDGKISSFQSKLKKKGFKTVGGDKGKKFMKGEFDGKESTLYIHYDKKSKVVYEVLIAIPCYSENSALSTYNSLKKRLHRKYIEIDEVKAKYLSMYPDSLKKDSTHFNSSYPKSIENRGFKDGYETTSFMIQVGRSDILYLGGINLMIAKLDGVPFYGSYDLLKYNYTVLLSYSDTKNTIQYGDLRDDL